MSESARVFSVASLVRQVRMNLASQFSSVQVQGEISSFTSAGSGHWYLGLKDGEASLKAVMFRPRNVLAGFTPRVGDKVILSGSLSIYEARGELQMLVDTLKKAGQGDLYEQFLRLKEKLSAEGLFDSKHKRPLPDYVFDIAVITSPQAAALADVQRALSRRCPHVRFKLYPTAVQGEAAVAQLVRAIERADEAGHQLLVLCRGGGSLEDLWCFNSEAVVRAVFKCQTPLITGVGHETDTTLVDFVADLRAATPTAAAEAVSVPTQELLQGLEGYLQALRRNLVTQWKTGHQHLNNLTRQSTSAAQFRLQSLTQRVDRGEAGLVTPTALVARQQQSVELLAAHLGTPLTRRLQKMSATLDAQENTVQQKVRRNLDQSDHRLAQLSAVLSALSPQRTLDRGYAIVQNEAGQVVMTTESLGIGQSLTAQLSTGRVGLTVQQLDENAGIQSAPENDGAESR